VGVQRCIRLHPASSISVPEEAQLRLYNFYKFVTEPSSFKLKELVPIWDANEGINSELGGMHVSVRDLNAVEVLAKANTVLNAKHIEGHWTLQYAIVCDGEDVTAWLVQHHVDLQIKDMVLNTLTNRCLRNCFSLIQSSCLHPFSCGWDAVLHRQPWPPPVQLVILANDVQVRPLMWPSFYWHATLVLWIKSLVVAGSIVPKLPWWAFDPGNLCKVVGSCNMSKHVA
jgi:hypothetical protein